jgi:hypothetical protein
MASFIDVPALNCSPATEGALFRLRVVSRPYACFVEACSIHGVIARWSSYSRLVGQAAQSERTSKIIDVTAVHMNVPSVRSFEFYFEADKAGAFSCVSDLRRGLYASVMEGEVHRRKGVAVFALTLSLPDCEPSEAELTFRALLSRANRDAELDSLWQSSVLDSLSAAV